ncbi:DUF3995 domain-containing protein [Kitasatospora sp. NPDC091207]|uniref:DUF3995 domain-containing protein n=1 Tax=Kitasatospora sp. NPDC091207 TaxID=3364083 RepID=UPI00382A5F50
MNRHRSAALAVAVVLAADGLLHVYWATGSTWPAPDAASLSRAVLNAEVPFTPRVVLPLAALLCSGATVVLARGGLLDGAARRLPAVVLRWGPRAVAGGLLARGLAGLVWASGTGTEPGSAFHRLNLALYTPLCLAGAAAALAVARGPLTRATGRRPDAPGGGRG